MTRNRILFFLIFFSILLYPIHSQKKLTQKEIENEMLSGDIDLAEKQLLQADLEVRKGAAITFSLVLHKKKQHRIVYMRALRGLGILGKSSNDPIFEKSVGGILKFSNSKDWELRFGAILALGLVAKTEKTVKKVIPVITKSVSDKQNKIVQAALANLGLFFQKKIILEKEAKKIVPKLLRILDSNSSINPNFVISTLGLMGIYSRKATKHLCKLLKSQNEKVRINASWALANILCPKLISFEIGKDFTVGDQFNKGQDPFWENLNQSRYLFKIKKTESIPESIETYQRGNYYWKIELNKKDYLLVQTKTRLVLYPIIEDKKTIKEIKEAVPFLTEALYDRSFDVRSNAAETLGHVGILATEAIPALTEIVKNNKDTIFTKNSAWALNRIKKLQRDFH